MIPPNFSTYSSNEIIELFKESSIDNLQMIISHLNNAQIILGITALQNQPHIKLLSLIQKLDRTHLETAGKALSSKQFIDLLESFSNGQCPPNKLSSLLVGLPFYVFMETIQIAPNHSLEILKQEEILEPLQHQLNLLGHEYEKKLLAFQNQTNHLCDDIHKIDIEELSFSDLDEMRDKIIDLENEYQLALETIDKGLSIIWNTARIDLIEKFSHLKEATHSQYIRNIGKDDGSGIGPGLFPALDRFLGTIYEIEPSSNNHADNDLAIEGLTKLSIWYLKDYWEAGLLPNIKHQDELEHQEKQQLFNLVQTNLQKFGIATIKDLKKAQIFSKPMLKEYVKRHQSRCLPH